MLLAQLPGDPTDSIVKLLAFGQVGAALAMLLLGFYLYWQASNAAAAEIEQRKRVACQFMLYALIFFVLCMIGEILKNVLPQPDRPVVATISIPPMDDYTETGGIEIDHFDGKQVQKQQASNQPARFDVRNGAIFTISLNKLITKLTEAQRSKQVLENRLPKTLPELGPASPQ